MPLLPSMPAPTRTRRPTCPRCLRAQRGCICRWITPITPAGEVLILQHPQEAGAAKNSGRLLHLSLPGSQLAIGEMFNEALLQQWLYMPSASGAFRQPLLLYPAVSAMPDTACLPLSGSSETAPSWRLVVLDATWRKSRKMLHLNPLLQSLPRLSLPDAPPSRYQIRKAERAHQLSTLEAACRALMQLEQDEFKYQPLLQTFQGFVAQQIDSGMLTLHRRRASAADEMP